MKNAPVPKNSNSPVCGQLTGWAAIIAVALALAGPQRAAAQVSTLTVTCSVDKNDIWPPNHNLVDVGLHITVTDTAPCTPNQPTVQVYSNEDDQDTPPTADANFSPDAKYNSSKQQLRLRAERSDPNGRVYLIIVTVTDNCGQTAKACCTAVIPHDRSDASVVAVDTMAETAQNTCDMTGNPPPGYFPVGEPGAPVLGPKQ